MADVIERTTGRYLRSVSTGRFPIGDYIHLNDPATVGTERARIEAIPQRYRKVTGDVLSEMNAAEKTTVDDAIAAATETARKAAIPTATALKSPDGSEWEISVNDAGAVSTRKI